MSVTQFPVTRSVLTEQSLLLHVVENYQIGLPTVCHFLYPGLNDTYEIFTENDRFILRVYRAGWREYEHIRYELEILTHLDRSGVPVSSPIAMKNGLLLQEIDAPEGLRYAALFTYAPGVPLERDEEHAERYGEAAGLIHSASADFRSAFDRPAIDLDHLIDAPIDSVLPYLAHRPEDRDYIQRLADKLRNEIIALPAEYLTRGFCHGDLHGGNAHLSADGVTTFFDFDCCGVGWLAYDVAVYRWQVRRLNKEEALWPAFLRGYTKCNAITDHDLSITLWFVAMRQIWWLGLNTGTTQHNGRGWINERHWDRAFQFLRGCEGELGSPF